MFKKLHLLVFCILFAPIVFADIVKPALVEISVNADGHYKIEIRASIEAMLTGINSQYKNTSESPNADKYDVLRKMSASELLTEFKSFKQKFTQIIKLKLDDEIVSLNITEVQIPEPGYIKIPRISLIILQGKIDHSVSKLSWYYPDTFADNVVRVRQIDTKNEKWHWSSWQWLQKDQWSKPFSLNEVFRAESIWSVISTYTSAGFNHIIPKGLDHILFILGIFLLTIKIKSLLLQVTMFTLAHSITLSLAMLEIFALPANIVEPLIALSIAYIGIENIITKEVKTSRLVVVFVFGLLHGMGFASMLSDFGMPSHAFATALITFNIGVELGQILIIVLASLLVSKLHQDKVWYRANIIIPASLLISLIGLYWTYERIVFY